MLMTIYECNLFYVYILSMIFFIGNIYVSLNITKKNLNIRGYLDYVANARDS